MKTFLKWVKRIVSVIMVIFVLLSIIASFKACEAKPPDTLWGIQTYTNDQFRVPSRYYYAEKLDYVHGYPVLRESWWSFDGNRYHKHNGDKEFPPGEYGPVDVIKRRSK